MQFEDRRSHWDLQYEQGLPSLEKPDPFYLFAFSGFVPDRRHARRLRAAGLLVTALLLAGDAFSQTTLTLHQAIQRAESSPMAHQAQDQVDAAQGMVRQAGLRPNPRLYIQSEDLRPWANDFDFANNTEDYAYVGESFELAGKRGKRMELASANIRRSEAEQQLMDQQIAGRVAGAYWSAVASARVVKLLEDDLKVVDDMVRYHKERVDAGAMRGADLVRMQIERDRLVMALEAARRDMIMARIELFRQMDRPDDPSVQLTDAIDNLAPIETQSLATVLAARADVAAAKEAVAAAVADVKLQKAMGVPDLDLLGGYKRDVGTNTAYGALQIPLPFGNRNQGEIARAQANLTFAQDQLQQVEMSVRADVASAEEGYARQRDIVEHVLPDMHSRAQQNLAIMSDAYKTGGMDLLRYIDAERTAIDVEVSALRALAEFQQSALRLTLAYGGRP
jgi:cobalt-zinc-cadmium efflux system outer membrane protein